MACSGTNCFKSSDHSSKLLVPRLLFPWEYPPSHVWNSLRRSDPDHRNTPSWNKHPSSRRMALSRPPPCPAGRNPARKIEKDLLSSYRYRDPNSLRGSALQLKSGGGGFIPPKKEQGARPKRGRDRRPGGVGGGV